MFLKRKGFTLVELLIVIIVIGILAGGMMLASGSATDSARASTLVSELRNAKAAGFNLLADNNEYPWSSIILAWNTNNLAVTDPSSFDEYMDNSNKVRQLLFVAVDNGSGNTWLLVGKNVPDPIVADKMIGMVGGALYNDQGLPFARTDADAYMRVK